MLDRDKKEARDFFRAPRESFPNFEGHQNGTVF